MSEALDFAAREYRKQQANLAKAAADFERAKLAFIQVFQDEVGDVGKFSASDGFTYGRTYREGKTKFDFDRFLEEQPMMAHNVSKLVLDTEKLQNLIENDEVLRPLVQQYVETGEPTVAMLPVTTTKEEAPEDE